MCHHCKEVFRNIKILAGIFYYVINLKLVESLHVTKFLFPETFLYQQNSGKI